MYMLQIFLRLSHLKESRGLRESSCKFETSCKISFLGAFEKEDPVMYLNTASATE